LVLEINPEKGLLFVVRLPADLKIILIWLSSRRVRNYYGKGFKFGSSQNITQRKTSHNQIISTIFKGDVITAGSGKLFGIRYLPGAKIRPGRIFGPGFIILKGRCGPSVPE